MEGIEFSGGKSLSGSADWIKLLHHFVVRGCFCVEMDFCGLAAERGRLKDVDFCGLEVFWEDFNHKTKVSSYFTARVEVCADLRSALNICF